MLTFAKKYYTTNIVQCKTTSSYLYLAFSSFKLDITMTGTVIAVPTNFMTQVQNIVNGFIGTITAWFPDLILISLVVSLTFAGVYFIKKWVRGSGKGK